MNLPGQHTENEVHDEERTENNQGHEESPLPRAAHRVFDLCGAYTVLKTSRAVIRAKIPPARICTIQIGETHPVEHVGPALEGDALENREHGQSEIVKVRYPVVRAFPVALRVADVVVPQVSAVEPVHPARMRIVHHLA